MKITSELLTTWEACSNGYERFNQLFPEGADLKTAMEGLTADGHEDWSIWLFNKCRKNNLFLEITKDGYKNSGYYNSGNRNSGNRNSGYCNSGDYNSGDRNSGYCNSGDYNSGDRNSGNRNSGYCNSGDRNSGNRNSGYCNSGDRNSGIFNSVEPSQMLFNKPTNLMFDSDEIQRLVSIINSIKTVVTWIWSENMTDEEKKANPSHETTGGYLKKRDFKYCWQKGWEEMSEDDKEFIKSLPNFCPKIFKEITGVEV